jgi:predicted dehydrogenase
MSDRIDVAIVGCGSITQRGLLPHLTRPDATALLRVVALCDVDEERAAQLATRYRIPAVYTSAAALLQEAEIDALLIATPAPFHYEIGLAAVRAGVHVHVQKPLTVSVAEADQLIAAAAERDVRIVASPVQMLGPGAQRIRQIVRDGTIGRIYWALASTAFVGHEHEPFRAEQPVDPSWYYKRGGGPMYDMATYTLHTLTGILGPVRQVSAMSGIGLPTRHWQGQTINVEMDDNTLLLLEFDGGCFGVVGGHFAEMGQVIGWGFMGIYGSSGALEVTDLYPDTAYPSHVTVNPPALAANLALSGRPNLEGVPAYIAGPHQDMGEAHLWADIRYLLDCIHSGEDHLQTAAHARHVIEIIEKGYLAARSGATQPVTTTFATEERR